MFFKYQLCSKHYDGQCKPMEFTCCMGAVTCTEILRMKEGLWGHMPWQWLRSMSKGEQIVFGWVKKGGIVGVGLGETSFEQVSRRGWVLVCGRGFQQAGLHVSRTHSWKGVYGLRWQSRAVVWREEGRGGWGNLRTKGWGLSFYVWGTTEKQWNGTHRLLLAVSGTGEMGASDMGTGQPWVSMQKPIRASSQRSM